MKIHNLKFENINSLKGKWEIDFDNPELTRENIFLITGKTGSGKSSIFDAITLALYGETTRQGKITGTSNELMNKHSGECSSEVIFSSKGIKYQAIFNQHRSRNNPEGNLQGKKQALFNLKTGDNLVSKTNKLEDITREIIGLNFNQFSKTVMLAQGSFDIFLKAKDDEKADILEQITGTQIYSEISKKIFEHHKEESNKLDNLNKILEGIELLTEEETAEKLNTIKEQEENISLLNNEISSNNIIISHYKKLEEITLKENNLSTLKNELDREEEEYSLNAKNIANYNKVKVILDSNNQIKSLNQEIEKETFSNDSLNKNLTTKVESQTILNAELNSKLESKEKETLKLTNLNTLIKQVRQIDNEIYKTQNNYNISKERLDNINKTIEEHNKQSIKEKDNLKENILSLKQVDSFFNNNIKIKKYVENQDLILDRLDKYVKLNTQITEKEKPLKEDIVKKEHLEQDWLVLNKEKTIITEELNKISKKQEEINLTELEYSQLIPVLHKELSELESSKNSYLKYYKYLNQYNEAIIKLKELDNQLSTLEKDIITKSTIISKEKEIIGLKSYIHLLEEGKPCPLCGSINHTTSPLSNDSTLVTLNKELNNLKEEFDNLTKEKTSLDISKNTAELIVQEEKPNLINNYINEIIKENNLENELYLRISKLTAKIESYEKKKIQIDNIKKEYNLTKEKLDQIDNKILVATEIKAQNNTRIKKIKDELKLQNTQKQELLKTLDTFIISFSYKELSNIFTQYNTNIDKKTSLSNSFKSIENSLEELDKNNKDLTTKYNIQNNITKEYTQQLKQLKNERFNLFEEKNCDIELEKQNKIIKEIENEISIITEKSNPLNTQIIKLKENIKTSNDLILKFKTNIIEMDKIIENELKKLNIEKREIALSFDLDEQKRKNIEIKIKEHDEKEIKYNTLNNELNKEKEETSKFTLEISKETAQEKQNKLQKQRDEAISAKSSLETELKINDLNKDKFKGQEKEISKQKHLVSKWKTLNDLIGSATGKAFKAIAQAITLDYLLINTNNKLSELFPRYELYRITEKERTSLDLGVIDKYSAAIKRPITNLSGGETFIISFSLALGLSDLLNQKVSIETLFLDEGFGTLDEETLTQSLEAIVNLTKTGKVIGLISHVSLLHDRIRSQIKVQENGDSTSSLIGPGIN